MENDKRRIWRRRGRFAAGATGLVAVCSLGLSGCESVLDVKLPGSVTAETLDNPAMAATINSSVIGDFECAFANYVNSTALLSAEMIHSSGWLEVRIWSQRRITPQESSNLGDCRTTRGFGTYLTLHTARVQAEDARKRFEGWDVANKNSVLATAAAYAGYATALLGEGYCEMVLDGGPIMTPAQVLAVAEDRFGKAIDLAQQAGNSDIVNMARVGRARVRLDLGKKGDAAADAKLVPDGYTKLVTRSAEERSRNNRIWLLNQDTRDITVPPDFRNLRWQGTADSRVRSQFSGGKGFDAETDLWYQLKYTARTTPVTLASWKEAQLIIAEAEGGQTAVQIINELHRRAGLPAFGGGDAAAIQAQVVEERRRELWLEGHRLNDMLRLKIPFLSGVDHTNQPYGPTTCLPLPLVERTGNPNIKG